MSKKRESTKIHSLSIPALVFLRVFTRRAFWVFRGIKNDIMCIIIIMIIIKNRIIIKSAVPSNVSQRIGAAHWSSSEQAVRRIKMPAFKMHGL